MREVMLLAALALKLSIEHSLRLAPAVREHWVETPGSPNPLAPNCFRAAGQSPRMVAERLQL